MALRRSTICLASASMPAATAEELTRRLPVVVLTSSDEEQDILASYDLGANSYVRKPVEFHQFIDALGQLGLYWLVLNQPPPPVSST